MALNPGDRLAQYTILSPIGAGGMGEIYRARDIRLDREVAIKVMADHIAADPEMRRRFETEARAVAALSHPSILAIHELESLQAMIDHHVGGTVFIGVDPTVRLLAGEPRYEAMLNRVGVALRRTASAPHTAST